MLELDLTTPNSVRALQPNCGEVVPPAGVALKHLSPTIGTEVSGLKVNELTPELTEFIHALLRTRKVLLFREQDITAEEQVTFAETWGEVMPPPFAHHSARDVESGSPKIWNLNYGDGYTAKDNFWHSDATWLERPPKLTVLRSNVIPPIGGDTLFADMVAAYEALPDEMQAMLDGLYAVHNLAVARTIEPVFDHREVGEQLARFAPQIHPIVRTNPDTGKKGLYCTRHAVSHIVGLPRNISRTVIDFVCQQADVPEYQCRLRWTPNAVAVWDNVAVQHYALSDYAPVKRSMTRVTICGGQPV